MDLTLELSIEEYVHEYYMILASSHQNNPLVDLRMAYICMLALEFKLLGKAIYGKKPVM